MIHDTLSAQISQKQNGHNIYAIMKTLCPPSYHHNGFVASHALGHMIYGYTLLVPVKQSVLNKLSKEHNMHDMCMTCHKVHDLPQSHCGDNHEGTLFLWLHIYYAHLAFVKFEHSVCHGSLMTNYVMLLA